MAESGRFAVEAGGQEQSRLEYVCRFKRTHSGRKVSQLKVDIFKGPQEPSPVESADGEPRKAAGRGSSAENVGQKNAHSSINTKGPMTSKDKKALEANMSASMEEMVDKLLNEVRGGSKPMENEKSQDDQGEKRNHKVKIIKPDMSKLNRKVRVGSEIEVEPGKGAKKHEDTRTDRTSASIESIAYGTHQSHTFHSDSSNSNTSQTIPLQEHTSTRLDDTEVETDTDRHIISDVDYYFNNNSKPSSQDLNVRARRDDNSAKDPDLSDPTQFDADTESQLGPNLDNDTFSEFVDVKTHFSSDEPTSKDTKIPEVYGTKVSKPIEDHKQHKAVKTGPRSAATKPVAQREHTQRKQNDHSSRKEEDIEPGTMAESDASSGTESDAETESYAETQSDGSSEGDEETGSESDTRTETESDAGTESDLSYESDGIYAPVFDDED